MLVEFSLHRFNRRAFDWFKVVARSRSIFHSNISTVRSLSERLPFFVEEVSSKFVMPNRGRNAFEMEQVAVGLRKAQHYLLRME